MVLGRLLCAFFPRVARKKRTLKGKYRSNQQQKMPPKQLHQERIAMSTRFVSHPRARIALLLLILLLLAACTRAAQEAPTQAAAPATKAPAVKAPAVLQGDFRTHDPSMIRDGGVYYVFSTGD